MLPLIGIIMGAVTTLTAGEACIIGASVGAASAIGLNAFTKKGRIDNGNRDDEALDEALRVALKILKERQRI